MGRCLELAKKGYGYARPNPMVGAVLVYKNRIIGEGWHQIYGQAHAEVNCLQSVNKADQPLIQASTLYVSLEPCAHYGKTPPCADLIIRHQIPKVVVGCVDSYGEVAGQGIQRLRDAGVEVITDGPWEKDCINLNRRFFTFHSKKRPYIILKWAATSDNYIAPLNQKGMAERIKISSPATDRLVHKWRSQEAAIMVGTNTALLDNPALTNRLYSGPNPIRLVLDQQLQLSPTAAVIAPPAKTILFNEVKSGLEQDGRLSFVKIDFEKDILPQVLASCYSLGIQSILVEGGARLLQSFLDQNLWDECRIIIGTALKLNGGLPQPDLHQARLIQTKCLGQDKISYFAPPNG